MRPVIAVLLGCGLVGCAPPAAPIVLAPQPGAPSGIDGRYRGTARLIRSDNRFCPRSGPRVYEVQNGTVTLSYQGAGRARIPLTAQIQSNGEFDTSDGQGRLQGKVANGGMYATIGSPYCEHHWTMQLIN